ncbi:MULTISPECIES: penicillin acylase family protein [Nocardia]|uniref:penicillin acylase family protein n=1 Tax=Nocardia TaxID=1817 RepID=UPI000A53E8CB|nr:MULTISPECIES: penicillin acylase family protein [Nocardia]
MSTTVHPVHGLDEPVEILIDTWGIAHIYAASTEDVFFAQGYNAARERLFQLDLWRRRGLGLMAEAFGPTYIDHDRAARLLAYRGDLDTEWDAYGDTTRTAVTRFVAGINAYIDRLDTHPEDLPPEFALTGHRPARWAPEDVVRPRAHAPVFNLMSQVHRARVAAVADLDADTLRQGLAREHRAGMPEGIDPDLPAQVLAPYLLATGRTSVPVPKDVVEGSNCWAVAADRTATGRPVLAGDPHRGYATPSLRYIVHLCAPGLDVIGAGEPHTPGIALGHNGTAAFGFTVCPIDTEDLVVCDLGTEHLDTVTETIPVRGGDPAQVELQFTRHGPVLHVDHHHGNAYVLRSTWFQPGTAPYLGSLESMTATTWPRFDAALQHWRAPGENHVYADIHGTIASRSAGLVPRRVGYDGLLPVPADPRYRWNGFLAPDEFATTLDPPTGFIASANEFNVPDGYPLPSYEWPGPDRHTRIVEVLAQQRSHTLTDSATLQNDLLSVSARSIIELLRATPPPDNDTPAAAARELLEPWDAVETADSAAAALFELWSTHHLGPAVLRAATSPQAAALIAYPDPGAVHHWLRHPPTTGHRDRLLHTTLATAFDDLTTRLGPDPRTWSWGALHRNTQPHLLGHLEHAFDVGSIPIGGSNTTVASGAYWPQDFSPFLGASFRMIIDVGGWDNSLCVNTPGQSGDPRSPHYRDLLDTWARGGYVPLLYTRPAVERHTTHRIRLEAKAPQ